MPWWSGLDDDVYVPLDELKGRARPAPPGGDAPGEEPAMPGALAAFRGRPTAVLARQVAAANYETLWFARLARRHGFEPLVIEHRADRFTLHNPYKRSLGTLPVVVGRDRDGRRIVRRQRVVDGPAAEGRRFEDVETKAGEPLLDYHHRKLAGVLGPGAPRWIDLGEVLPPGPGGPHALYVALFKLLTGDLVLFEDFVACDQTAAFFQRTVEPAWRQAVAETGRRPQVARLSPGARSSWPLWYAYPAAVADDPVRGRAREPEMA